MTGLLLKVRVVAMNRLICSLVFVSLSRKNNIKSTAKLNNYILDCTCSFCSIDSLDFGLKEKCIV